MGRVSLCYSIDGNDHHLFLHVLPFWDGLVPDHAVHQSGGGGGKKICVCFPVVVQVLTGIRAESPCPDNAVLKAVMSEVPSHRGVGRPIGHPPEAPRRPGETVARLGPRCGRPGCARLSWPKWKAPETKGGMRAMLYECANCGQRRLVPAVGVSIRITVSVRGP